MERTRTRQTEGGAGSESAARAPLNVLALLVVPLGLALASPAGAQPAQQPAQPPGQPAQNAVPPVQPEAAPTDGASPGAAVPTESQVPGGKGETSLLTGFMEPFEYDPRGRRDPFAQPVIEKPLQASAVHGPVMPLQRYELPSLRLIGIIWDVTRPKAMIQDPESKVHIVGVNAKIGTSNGYIATIREGEIVVIETSEEEGRLLSAARVVKIATGSSTASAK